MVLLALWGGGIFPIRSCKANSLFFSLSGLVAVTLDFVFYTDPSRHVTHRFEDYNRRRRRLRFDDGWRRSDMPPSETRGKATVGFHSTSKLKVRHG